MNEYTNNKTYKSQKIPGQATLFENTVFSASNIDMFDDNQGFAEMEINTGQTPAGSVSIPVPIPQSIPSANDPVRIAYIDMRNIARDNYVSSVTMQSQFYNKRVQHNNSIAFYKQAIFMKDFEDDYDGDVLFSAYFPNYQLMGYEQFRTYFTWRTKVRKGEIKRIGLSYAFVYIYELLNNIGVDNPEDGLNKLMTFWKAFREFDNKVDKYILKWLKDYHIFYDLPQAFQTFIYENNIYMHYPKVLQYQSDSGDNFELFCNISKYDIRKSSFYQSYEGEKRDFIPNCFQCVMEKIRDELQAVHLNLDQMLFYTTPKSSVWPPFEGALFYPWFQSPDRMVILSEQEIYICSQNKWSFSTTIVMEKGKQLAGYIMKQMESALRQAANYKFKLSANISMIKGTIVPILDAHGISLERIIKDTVFAYYREQNKIIVAVDETALSQIRKEAIDTQEKLIVPEPEESAVPIPTVISAAAAVPADEWTELWQALTKIELDALSLILEEGNIKQYAHEQHMMLEVLVDRINEKAVDTVGDNLLELDDQIIIYEEYQESITEMVKKNGK